MIVGTGVDIIEVSRVEEALGRFGDRFLSRIFTEKEIRYCNTKRNRTERFAARFAAKEAAMKALGTGLRCGVSWQHIEVGHEPGGRPTIIFSEAAAKIAAQLGAKRVSLSLSHTAVQAIAHVILES